MALEILTFSPIIFRQSVKKCSGATKEIFPISKAKTLSPPFPLNQCYESKERKKNQKLLASSSID